MKSDSFEKMWKCEKAQITRQETETEGNRSAQ